MRSARRWQSLLMSILNRGDQFADIAAKLHAAAESPDASDRSVSLGIGIKMVEDLSGQVDQRAKGGRC